MNSASKVRAKRTQLGLSIEGAARLANISSSMWAKIEYGERAPSLQVAKRIAATLATPLDELFGA